MSHTKRLTSSFMSFLYCHRIFLSIGLVLYHNLGLYCGPNFRWQYSIHPEKIRITPNIFQAALPKIGDYPQNRHQTEIRNKLLAAQIERINYETNNTSYGKKRSYVLLVTHYFLDRTGGIYGTFGRASSID